MLFLSFKVWHRIIKISNTYTCQQHIILKTHVIHIGEANSSSESQVEVCATGIGNRKG